MEKMVDEIKREVGRSAFVITVCMSIFFLMTVSMNIIIEEESHKQHMELLNRIKKLENKLK